MTKILHLDSSGRHEHSVTRKLSQKVVDAVAGGNPVTTRDIGRGFPVVDDAIIDSYFTKPENRTPLQRQAVAISDELVNELHEHDVYVFGIPVYNFTMPAAFKSWADMVARAGMTFKYTENGPVGLLEGKKAYIVIASGGTNVGSEIDFLSPWLTHFFGFIGITDIELITADGLSRDAEHVMAAAEAQIAKIVV